jgi:hypothetical protein
MINSVRNSVLSILNKNNYGYISPSDFNLYATNAQMELFEDYFSTYNKTVNAENMRQSGDDYANLEKPIAEVLEYFLVTDYLSQVSTNTFYAPSLITTGNESYMLLKLLCYTKKLKSGTNTSVVASQLVDSTALFLSYGISSGDKVVNLTSGVIGTVVTVLSNTVLTLDSNIFTTSPVSYTVLSSSVIRVAEKVSSGMITILNNSPLTNPSLDYPAYVSNGLNVTVYPTTIDYKGQVQANYFRYPKVPKWTYSTLTGGEPSFNQSQPDYQDFELPQEDEYKLIMKILQYCGISIRENDVIAFANNQEQKQ